MLKMLWDGLANAITGAGTRADRRTANAYAFVPLTEHMIVSAFRGSGLIRKIITIPADDTVREWREFKGESADIASIFAEEKRLGVQQKLHLAEVMRGLGGGAFILGLPGNPSQPAPAIIGTKGLAYIHVVNRWQLNAVTWVDNPLDPLFGGPSMWRMSTGQGQVDIHPSRVIPFRGDALPSVSGVSQDDLYWGESRVQRVLDAAQDADTARGAFATLITKASRLRLGIPNLSQTLAEGGEADVSARLAIIAQGEGILNATVYDSGDQDGKGGEKIDDVSYNFAGMKDVMDAFGLWLSAIADIPATRLLGRAAEGMNASGDSQQKDWGKRIRAHQTLFTGPCLDALDKYLIPSALGNTPPGIWWDFPPLDMPSEKEAADTFKTTMDAIEKLQNTGTIPAIALAKGVQSKAVEEGWLPGLEQALEEVPAAERYGIEQEAGADDETDPSALPVAANDATPRPLYVKRRLLNASALIAWAKSQGFTSTIEPGDMHVTVLYSRAAVDPIEMGETWGSEPDGGLIVKAGGPRALERFNEGAVVLQFASWSLTSRHADMVRAGASHDWPEYLPHVTLTYNAPEGLDLEAIKPYVGELRFGPEEFEPLDLDWKAKVGEA